MKKLILVVTMLLCLVTCNKNPPPIEGAKKTIRDFAFNLANISAKDSKHCRSYTSPAYGNILWYSDTYKYKIEADFTQYKGIIMGDSTMDIASRYVGYINPSVNQSVAVSGNTLCDVIEQGNAVRTVNPEFVIVGSLGGNDLLQGVPGKLIVQTAKEMVDLFGIRFPATRKVGILIHPSNNIIGNEYKSYVNDRVKQYSEDRGWCIIDPADLMTLGIDGKPRPDQMIDNIHYSYSVTLSIKAEIANKCGILF